MNAQTQSFSLQGHAGNIECKLDLPASAAPLGVALIAHPHPLFGGSMDNKVVQTLVRAFLALGYVCARMNFRGVGGSAGLHDNGIGETDDMALLHAHMVKLYPELPVALGGFSFGTFVLSRLNQQLTAQDKGAERLVLVGCAAGKWELAPVPPDTLLIHGEQDDTIPLNDVFDWARPQDLPVVVIPGADHFFHRKLHHIKQIVIAAWRAA
ncbi:MAG: alpha/beta hydrolase [Oxalobacteraceae bacterium]|jgi:hypothetical protein|nr:alpha/beta hydrolase [Oxalobacteraceae bacterium]